MYQITVLEFVVCELFASSYIFRDVALLFNNNKNKVCEFFSTLCIHAAMQCRTLEPL